MRNRKKSHLMLTFGARMRSEFLGGGGGDCV